MKSFLILLLFIPIFPVFLNGIWYLIPPLATPPVRRGSATADKPRNQVEDATEWPELPQNTSTRVKSKKEYSAVSV